MFSYTAWAAKKGPSDLLQQLWLCWGTEMMLVGVKVGHQTSQTAAAQALCSWRGFNNRFAMMDKDISCDNDDVGAKLSLIFNNRLAMHCKAAVAMMYKNISRHNQWSTMMVFVLKSDIIRCSSSTLQEEETHQLFLFFKNSLAMILGISCHNAADDDDKGAAAAVVEADSTMIQWY